MKNVERTAQEEGIAEEKEGESSDHKDKQKMRGPKKERMVHIHILTTKKSVAYSGKGVKSRQHIHASSLEAKMLKPNVRYRN